MIETKSKRIRDFAILAVLAIFWVALDQITKACMGPVAVNETVAGPFLGIFDITLVHNTGAAWGIFNDNAVALGVFSLLICVIAIAYLGFCKPPASIWATIGLSLIVAGGIGNAIDRFSHQYVVDFIRPVFIDFPVFNIADIGVTLGVVIFIAALLGDAFFGSKKDATDDNVVSKD